MLKPLNNMLFAEMIEVESKSKLIEIRRQTQNVFKVIEVGENKQGIKKGDKVFVAYGPCATLIEVEDEKFYIIDCDKVVGKIEE